MKTRKLGLAGFSKFTLAKDNHNMSQTYPHNAVITSHRQSSPVLTLYMN